jgi:Domain of unknown function (DUF1871)
VRTRSDYDAALHAVGAVINAWDPYSLAAGGAPRDEFEAEIARLVSRIPQIHSPADAAREISAVFSAAFEPEHFTVEACADVGAQLYERLQNAGLLSTRGV